MLDPAMSARSAADALLALPIGQALRSRLSEPWRSYHAWAHPMAMIDVLDRAQAEGVVLRDAVACVGFCVWHDAVYDPKAQAGRNEELSALLCETEMSRVASTASTISAAAATRATHGHRLPDADTSPDGAIMLDADLAVLAFDPAAYAAYEAGIRSEYAHVDDDAFVRGRSAFLVEFLKRPAIYLSEWGRASFESKARANLGASLDRLLGST